MFEYDSGNEPALSGTGLDGQKTYEGFGRAPGSH